MHQNTLSFLEISEFIKLTQTDVLISNPNEIIRIAKLINSISINKENVHCILKLISNLVKFKIISESSIEFDLDNIIKIAIDKPIQYNNYSSDTDTVNTDTSYESDYSDNSNDNNKKLIDGDVISLINIYCSDKYLNINEAIKLINDNNVHKTASYQPIFKTLIKLKDHEILKSFYEQFKLKNIQIIEHNRNIKKYNQNVYINNEKIKFLKKKYNELKSIVSDNIISSKIKSKQLSQINIIYKQLLQININNVNDIIAKNERNIIEINNNILKDFINYLIEISDNEILYNLISNIYPSSDIISIVTKYFINNTNNYMYSNISEYKCQCCNKYLSNYIIPDIDRNNIMKKINKKITSISYRHDNYQVISINEKKLINNKWNEFLNLLDNNKFDIVIDGANLGFINSKGNKEINIDTILSVIKDISSKTNKLILLIIHQRHLHKIKTLLSTFSYYNIKIYTTPNNVNDDWFWLYASLHSRCNILSNDQSRDHGYMVSYQNEIKKWINHYQIKISNDKNISFDKLYYKQLYPGIYKDDNNIHIIFDINNKQYNSLCIPIKKLIY